MFEFCSSTRGGSQGFTLIEALLVLAILGVLAALALPAYQRHLLRAGRLEARLELMEVAADQERYFSRHGSYVADAQPLWSPAVDGRSKLTRDGRYEIEVRACDGSSLDFCFIATARATGGQSRDACALLSLTSDGSRGAEGEQAEVCWR